MFNQPETRKSEKPFLIGQRVLESGMGKYMLLSTIKEKMTYSIVSSYVARIRNSKTP